MKLQEKIKQTTGYNATITRFPGGSSNRTSKVPVENFMKILDERGIKYYDWNVSSGDATSKYGLAKNEIIRKCINGAAGKEEAMILMHDLPEKAATVEALPDIIEYFQSIGVEILPLDENVYVHHTIEMTE